MRLILLSFCSLLILKCVAQNNPVAPAGAIVEFGNARFTILTPQLIRMEYHPNRIFENKATQIVLNRKLPVPNFAVDKKNNQLTIITGDLVLNFINDGQRFSKQNLSIAFTDSNYKTWHPYTKDSLNLKGTTRTLDGWNGGSPEKLDDGIISLSGWAVINDSKSLLFNTENWIEPRKDTLETDWYFFGYKNNYKKALQDYTGISGKMVMPPQFAFGYWWSKYWVYSDDEIRKLAQDFKQRDIPIDVMIVDMDWHDVYGLNFNDTKTDPFGEPVGWTGYSWNKTLFPQPEKYLSWAKSQHLKTALNIHPASGITPMEPFYNSFAKTIGFDTTGRNYIPFELESKKFADAYNKIVLQPLIKSGVDFFWLDWQQWLETKKMKGLSNTWWLNHWFFNFTWPQNKRPFIFHRWGGLGNQRYPIGFSGDAIINWKTLAFETYFTATAANVGYGYWSHDIGGHNPIGNPTDGELYLRWIQFGAFSPILRTHSTKSKLIERRIWEFPQQYEAMKAAIKLRYQLFPYIYTSARKGYDSSLTICRPLYYENPNDSSAYKYPNEYYFGSNIIVAPVVEPINKQNGLSQKKIWLPAGKWVEVCSGTILQGNHEFIRQYTIDEIPYFIKAGTPLPLLSKEVKNLQEPSDTLVLSITAGGNGNFQLYEDDGNSSGYLQKQYANTNFSTSYFNEQKNLSIHISAAIGAYKDMKKGRYFQIELPNTLPPAFVKVDNKLLPYTTSAQNGYHTYNAHNLTLQINTAFLSKNSQHTIEVRWNEAPDYKLLNGTVGKFKRLNEAVEFLKMAAQSDFFLPDSLYYLQQTALRIQYSPQTAIAELAAFNKSFDAVQQQIDALPLDDTMAKKYAIAHLNYEVTANVLAAQAAEQKRIDDLSNRITLTYPFSPNYTGGGKAGLLDGKYAQLSFSDDNWQGYRGTDFEAIIDRQSDTGIMTQINLNCLQDDKNYIFLPKSVKVFGSSDNINFTELGFVNNDSILINNSNFIKKYIVDIKPTTVRFIKIVADAVKVCPPGHRGAGDKAWTFIDELELIKK